MSNNNVNTEEVNFTTNLPPDKVKRIVEALRDVYDPEIPINVYDLGLIYDIRLEDGNKLKVKMTLTAVGCPLSQDLGYRVGEALQAAVPEATDIDIDLVFDPPWTPLKMTPLGREMFKAIYGYDIVEQWQAQQAQEGSQSQA
ncbi:metal-sulfur cluster assembly factor [Caldivirga sp. UBA161]|uniref:metal-sulfur cluster assembly factor n=1 Tax=Caldivirga sp. UBA161 TaxID=1915569 RepID=UPI0025C3307A|nr:metal-sulfur cluster assembly factor [Caldivirga sp. UBA161]